MPTKEEIERRNPKQFMEHVRRVKGQLQDTAKLTVGQTITTPESKQVPTTDQPVEQSTLSSNQPPLSLASKASTETISPSTIAVEESIKETVILSENVLASSMPEIADHSVEPSLPFTKKASISLASRVSLETISPTSIVVDEAVKENIILPENEQVSLMTEVINHSVEPSVPLASKDIIGDNQQTLLSSTSILKKEIESVAILHESAQAVSITETPRPSNRKFVSAKPENINNEEQTALSFIWGWLPYVIVPAAVLVATCIFYRYKIVQSKTVSPGSSGFASAAGGIAQAAIQEVQPFPPGFAQDVSSDAPGSQVINAEALVAGAIAVAAVQPPMERVVEPEPRPEEIAGGVVEAHDGAVAAAAVIPRGLVSGLVGTRNAHTRDASMGTASAKVRAMHGEFLERLGREGVHATGPKSHADEVEPVADDAMLAEGAPPADATELLVEEGDLAGVHSD